MRPLSRKANFWAATSDCSVKPAAHRPGNPHRKPVRMRPFMHPSRTSKLPPQTLPSEEGRCREGKVPQGRPSRNLPFCKVFIFYTRLILFCMVLVFRMPESCACFLFGIIQGCYCRGLVAPKVCMSMTLRLMGIDSGYVSPLGFLSSGYRQSHGTHVTLKLKCQSVRQLCWDSRVRCAGP